MTRTAGASVHSINISDGGVPKRPIEACEVGANGLAGDRQRDLRYHGGPMRAVSLYSHEHIEALRAEGHPIEPGRIGENVTVRGLDWSRVVPGVRLRLGGVEIEVTGYAPPCRKIADSFRDGAFERVAQKRHPGWSRVYARVTQPGRLAVGATVELL